MSDTAQKYIKAAEAHAEMSGDADYEVGDLQIYFQTAYGLLTEEQRIAFAENEEVVETLELGTTESDNKPPTACPECNTALTCAGTVERHYMNKDAGEDAGEETDAIGFGHYLPDGTFEPDRAADLSGGRYNLVDDSDRCAICGHHL